MLIIQFETKVETNQLCKKKKKKKQIAFSNNILMCLWFWRKKILLKFRCILWFEPNRGIYPWEITYSFLYMLVLWINSLWLLSSSTCIEWNCLQIEHRDEIGFPNHVGSLHNGYKYTYDMNFVLRSWYEAFASMHLMWSTDAIYWR